MYFSILSKQDKNNTLFALVDKKEKIDNLDDLEFTQISLLKFGENEWRLLSKKDAENIFNIENIGSPLYKYVDKFVTGIATLQNDLFILKDNKKDLLEKEYNGKVYFIERDFTKKIIKPNRIKDTIALKNNVERVIYPYTIVQGKAQILKENLIKEIYPNAYGYLLAIKPKLLLRDKGKRVYKEWYAYGRTQGVADFGKKIILPMMGNKASFIMVNDMESLIYCGYAIFAKNDEDYKILERILNSDVMWYYIKKTSKNYAGGFKSFAKNYVKNFSIPSLDADEKHKLLRLEDQNSINVFLKNKYQISN
jgi:adenine-specific DNA-methyltransferase